MTETAERGAEGRTYECPDCGNTERFIRYRDPVIVKEEIDGAGRVLKDLGHVPDAEPDPEVRCASCDEIVAE